MEGRWKYLIGTAFLLAAAGIRLSAASPIPFLSLAAKPYLVVELPFIFVGAIIWFGLMTDGRWLASVILAGLGVIAYWVVTTGVGFA